MPAETSPTSFWTTLHRGVNTLLIIATGLVIVWSFAVVLERVVQNLLAERHHKQITILHWGSAQEEQIVQKLCDGFTAAHPDVSILRIQASDMESKLKTMMAAGTPPDLFYLPPELMPELASLKLIKPVDQFVNRDIASGNGRYLNDYFPILLDAYRYDLVSGRVGTGSLYALPKDFTTNIFYVNKDLFRAAGVPIPYGGWTWDEFEADMKKITALNGRPEFAGRKLYGADLQLGPSSLRCILWTFGADFFGQTFRDVMLDSPRAQDALNMIVRMRVRDHTVYNRTGIAKDAAEEFLIGDIGCLGPIGRWKVPEYKDITAFKWDVVPVPHAPNVARSAMIFTTGWAMASATKEPDVCFKLMKYLCGPEGAALQSRLGLAIPPLKSVANGPDFLSPPGIPPINYQAFLDAIPYARLEQNPPEPEWTRIVGDLISRSIQLGDVTPLQNAHEIRDAWIRELNSPLRRQQWTPMRWSEVICIAAVIFVTAFFALWLRIRREKLGSLDRVQERWGLMFITPWLIGFLCFTLGPMLVSILLSFTSWTGMTSIANAQSVGLANYKQLFTYAPSFVTSLRVTAYYVVLGVPVGQIAALSVALLMNSPVRGIALFRTIFFVPSIVSGVALTVLWKQIFNNDYGPLNEILRPLLHLFGLNPPDWFGRDANFFAIPAFVIMGLWGVGSGMIIYLAGLKGISGSLYEAARIDGAGPVRRLWNITLPMLSPLLFYNLVMGIIGSFQMFTQAYIMQGPNNSTLTYVVELYREAFEYHNMGYASALAWVLFVIILTLTILVFRGSRKLVYYEGLKS